MSNFAIVFTSDPAAANDNPNLISWGEWFELHCNDDEVTQQDQLAAA